MAVTVTENFVRKRVVLLNPLIIVDSVEGIDAGQAYSTSLVVSNIDGPTPDTVGKYLPIYILRTRLTYKRLDR